MFCLDKQKIIDETIEVPKCRDDIALDNTFIVHFKISMKGSNLFFFHFNLVFNLFLRVLEILSLIFPPNVSHLSFFIICFIFLLFLVKFELAFLHFFYFSIFNGIKN
jgi:hypothetical protein